MARGSSRLEYLSSPLCKGWENGSLGHKEEICRVVWWWVWVIRWMINFLESLALEFISFGLISFLALGFMIFKNIFCVA